MPTTVGSADSGLPRAPAIPAGKPQRLGWPDAAKAVAILLVVYYHATEDLVYHGLATKELFRSTLPFDFLRMPLFYFVSGVFAAIALQRQPRQFLNQTVMPVLWLFLLWNALNVVLRGPLVGIGDIGVTWNEMLLFAVYPYNYLWFIWALLIYYVVAWVFRSLPIALLLVMATVLHVAPPLTFLPWDLLASRFVFFVLGIAISSEARRFAGGLVDGIAQRRALLAGVAGVDAIFAVYYELGDANPIIEMVLSLSAIAAVVSLCAAMSETRLGATLQWIGQRTVAVYVLHMPLMQMTRRLVIKAGLGADVPALVAIETIVGIVLPLVAIELAPRLGFGWLFKRPAWFRFPSASAGKPDVAPAEADPGGGGAATVLSLSRSAIPAHGQRTAGIR